MTDLETLRHSTAHLLAAAVLDLWPKAKPTIGPPIETGFYYDFDDLKISEENLPKIEEKMHALLKTWDKFEKCENDSGQARMTFKDNPYKLELIKELITNHQSLVTYSCGNFVDLCAGPHVDDVKKLGHFKLLKVAGAYWRGNEKSKMLTRIYGTAFSSQKELDEYLKNYSEAEKRDHRKLGRELDLFTFSDLIGSGFPLYTQRGALVRRLINEYVEETQKEYGYAQVWTPQVAKAELFKISGHYDKYKDSMFTVHSHYTKEEFFLKPMNCPQHTQIYASKQHSYRDLPLRFSDFAMLYRDEKPGELNGLARTRSFSQDDCHIFCTEEQVDKEVDIALSMTKKIMETFGFKYRYRLSTRDPQHPEKYLGDPKIWDKVEKWAVEIMRRNKIDYFDGPGEAAFYAPKMDLMATDALGREWQLSTVQIDYVMPERFDLKYIDSDGKIRRPVMLHRAIVGSPERFIMILLEHLAGNLPTWLSPTQAIILPIADRHLAYAQTQNLKLNAQNIRCEIDDRSEKLGAKIRDAQLQKIPYMIIIGDKEVENEVLSIRKRNGTDMGQMDLNKFLRDVKIEVEKRSLD